MYFSSRREAGYRLALQLLQYRYENTAVVCMDESAVLVGQQIAASVHSVMTMFLSDIIDVPGEGVDFGSINQSGRFTYNSTFSSGEVSEYMSEFHGYLEDKKRESMSKINSIIGDGGIVDKEMLRDQNVIVVADGLPGGVTLDAVADFMKPIRIKKLIFAVPIASVEAVDRLHILADEMHVLGVTDNFMDVNHYYDNNELPSHDEVVQILNQTILAWR